MSVVGIIVLFSLALQAQVNTTVLEQEVQLREGANQVAIRGSKVQVKIVVRQSVAVAVTYQASASSRPVVLKAQDEGATSGNQNCPCGHSCWEDEVQQVCVCVCKSCGGGGMGKNSRVVIRID